MKIQTKIILLIAGCTLLGILSVSLFYYSENERVLKIFAIEAKGLEYQCDAIVKLVTRPLESFAYDYTFWDEMVTYTTARDEAWAHANIDTSLTTFKANAAWVYGLDNALIYSVNNLDSADLKALPMPSGAIGKLFASSRFCHFFVVTSAGLVEIRGATIHPGLDVQRKTPPRGYLFVARLWDRELLSQMETITGTRMTIDTSLSLYQEKQEPFSGRIMFHRTLQGWNGMTVAVLQVLADSEIVRIFVTLSRVTITIAAVLAVLVSSILIVSLTWWILIPLNTILRTLYTDDPQLLDRVASKRDELGHVAALIQKFFEQRRLLVTEIADRKKTEERLRIADEQFIKAFRLNPSLMTISRLETGSIIDANDAFVETTGYSLSELIGRSTVELGIVTRETRESYAALLRSGQAVRNLEITMHTRSGQIRYGLFSGEQMSAGGESIVVSVVSDITARKHADEELRKKMDELERFNKLAVGREIKMVELKERIRELEERLKKG